MLFTKKELQDILIRNINTLDDTELLEHVYGCLIFKGESILPEEKEMIDKINEYWASGCPKKLK